MPTLRVRHEIEVSLAPSATVVALRFVTALERLEKAMSEANNDIRDELEELGALAAQTKDAVAANTALVRGLLDQIEANAGAGEAKLREIIATQRANLDALVNAAQPGEQEPPVIEPTPTQDGGQGEDTVNGTDEG